MVKSHSLGTKRCSKCCQKTTQSKVTTDFHRKHPPHVQIFAYSILGRIEAPLEHWQPEEQHGFKNNRRIEEHLLTATKVIDKTLFANTPLWIVSLDLSRTLRLRGGSPWLLHMPYAN